MLPHKESLTHFFLMINFFFFLIKVSYGLLKKFGYGKALIGTAGTSTFCHWEEGCGVSRLSTTICQRPPLPYDLKLKQAAGKVSLGPGEKMS